MSKYFDHTFDLSTPRRAYYSRNVGLSACPECGKPLIHDDCIILLSVKSDIDEGEFMSNMSGSHFCKSCPVVVFDNDSIEQAAIAGIRGENNVRYIVEGIVDMNAVDPKKRHLQLGTDENPIPLVEFLPDLKRKPRVKRKKIGRIIFSAYTG